MTPHTRGRSTLAITGARGTTSFKTHLLGAALARRDARRILLLQAAAVMTSQITTTLLRADEFLGNYQKLTGFKSVP